MSSDDHRQGELEKKVEEEIERARSELTSVVLAKQREVISRMGEALEKIWKGEKRHSICEELKNRLREEIQRHIISEKTIEYYCKQEWKQPDKAKSGRKGAMSRNKRSSSSVEKTSARMEGTETSQGKQQQQNEQRREEQLDVVAIRNDGSIERTSDDAYDDISWQHREQELLDRLKGKEKEAAYWKEKAEEYEAAAQYYEQEGNGSVAAAEPTSKELATHQQVTSKQTTIPIPQPPCATADKETPTSRGYIEFEFWLPFDSVKEEMQRRFAKDGVAAKVWFGGVVDATTGKVLERWTGRFGEQGGKDDERLDATGP
jgi:hypothetical protein